MLTERLCSICRRTHQAQIWLYREEAGKDRLYVCLEKYLLLSSYEQDQWRRLYDPY